MIIFGIMDLYRVLMFGLNKIHVYLGCGKFSWTQISVVYGADILAEI